MSRLQASTLSLILIASWASPPALRAAAAPHPQHKPKKHDAPTALPLVAPPPLVAPSPAPVVESSQPTPQDASPKPAHPAVLTIETDNNDVHAATHAMGQAVREAYSKLGRNEAFHRVAIPYLVDSDEATQSRHMGQVLSEMLAAELGRTAPFVVIDRDRLAETMTQNHLADVYKIDTPSAVAFSRLLGAQTLLTGAVEVNEETYTVHLRQLDVQTGKFVLESQATLARDALESTVAEAVVERSINNAVWRSAIFPGWGQAFLQEPEKAVLMAGGGTLSLGTAVGFYVAGAVARAQYMQNSPGTVGQRQTANDRFLVGNVALAVYGAVWLINMADILLSTPPSTEVDLGTPWSEGSP